MLDKECENCVGVNFLDTGELYGILKQIEKHPAL